MGGTLAARYQHALRAPSLSQPIFETLALPREELGSPHRVCFRRHIALHRVCLPGSAVSDSERQPPKSLLPRASTGWAVSNGRWGIAIRFVKWDNVQFSEWARHTARVQDAVYKPLQAPKKHGAEAVRR